MRASHAVLAAFAQLLERPWLIAAGLVGLIGADFWPAATAVVLVGVGGFLVGERRLLAARRARLDPLVLAMLETVPEPMALSAADGRPLAMNRAWYEAFGSGRIATGPRSSDDVCIEETLFDGRGNQPREWSLRHLTRGGSMRPVITVSWASSRPVAPSAAMTGAIPESNPPPPQASPAF